MDEQLQYFFMRNVFWYRLLRGWIFLKVLSLPQVYNGWGGTIWLSERCFIYNPQSGGPTEGGLTVHNWSFLLHLLHSAKDQRAKRRAHKSIIGHWNAKLYDPSLVFYLSPLLFSLFFIIFSQMKRGIVWFLEKKIRIFWPSARPQDSVYMVDHQGSILAPRIQ